MQYTTESFIARAKTIHGNFYSYDKTVYIRTHENVIITCPIHGDFTKMPSNFLRGSGCSDCNGKTKITVDNFKERSNKIHDNKYDYSLITTINTVEDKVGIVCKDHGLFYQRVANHMHGDGCPDCRSDTIGKKLSLTTETFKQKALIKYGSEKYNYDKVNVVNINEKVQIFCIVHQIYFWQTPRKHLNSYCGCKECAKEFSHKNMTTALFIEKASVVHNNYYSYEKTVYINSSTKVIITCPEHKDFTQSPFEHLNCGSGCPKCSKNYKLTKDDFLKKANEKHNNKYSYDLTNFIDTKSTILITCDILSHPPFYQMVNSHLAGRGCPCCGILTSSAKNSSSLEEFKIKAAEIHGDNYNYDKSVYVLANEKIEIYCNTHKKYFWQTIYDHLNGSKCPECAIILNAQKRSLTLTEFTDKAKLKHGDKYNYDKSIYVNTTTKIEIYCKTHKKYFWQSPNSHLQGSGCPTCSHVHSILENEWLDYLGIPYEYRNQSIKINNKYYKPDAIDVDNKIIWEFYGDLWHGNPSIYNLNETNSATNTTFGYLYNKTMNKEIILKEAGYNLITIWEKDWLELKKSIPVK
jgi:hypothetical protein